MECILVNAEIDLGIELSAQACAERNSNAFTIGPWRVDGSLGPDFGVKYI